MNDKPKERSERQKKPYSKPELKKITLTPEEAVLGFCKMTGKTGPVDVNHNCHPAGNCQGIGS